MPLFKWDRSTTEAKKFVKRKVSVLITVESEKEQSQNVSQESKFDGITVRVYNQKLKKQNTYPD